MEKANQSPYIWDYLFCVLGVPECKCAVGVLLAWKRANGSTLLLVICQVLRIDDGMEMEEESEPVAIDLGC